MDIKEEVHHVTDRFGALGIFLSHKLRRFPTLTLGEQISYSSVMAGILLLVTSIILFIIS